MSAAKRPQRRQVHVVLSGEFDGWEATAWADFPAKLIADLASGNVERVIGVLDAIIIDHNMPNAQDKLAANMGDVDPYDGLMRIGAAIFDAIGKLPNR